MVHFETFQRLLKHGVEITKLHSVLKFNQSPYIRDFIIKNNESRRLAKSKLIGDNFKWINNSVYGRSIMSKIFKKYGIVNTWSFSGDSYCPRSGELIKSVALKEKNERTNCNYKTLLCSIDCTTK